MSATPTILVVDDGENNRDLIRPCLLAWKTLFDRPKTVDGGVDGEPRELDRGVVVRGGAPASASAEVRMSVLCLVRHGQASVHADDYDQLSPLGEEQGRLLGEHWADAARRFDRVYVGPLRRHRQTLDAVAAVYRRRGLPWPDAEPLAELDEHHGPAVLEHYAAELLPAASAEGGGSGPRGTRLGSYLKAYQQATRRWVAGELATPPGLEAWADFRRRVEAGVARIVDGSPRGLRVAAFTSGGAIAAAVGLALGLGDDRVLELSWRIRNGALTELLFSRGRLALDVFNATPQLEEDRLVTFI